MLRQLFLIMFACGMAARGVAAPNGDPVRIPIECEDMQGVDQKHFGPGKGWQVGRWGQDLYQNMTFGGAWCSRLRMAMTDANDTPAAMTAAFDVPADGMYKVWVKYECPPFFNYAFAVKVEPADSKGPAALDKVYGLRESPKHFSFMKTLVAGDLYWPWGMDHDAAEGYEARLAKGRYRITISKTKNPAPAGARSLDAVLITSDLSAISTPRTPQYCLEYPLVEELRRVNHVYFRFRNPKNAGGPIFIIWDHWSHRRPSVYYVSPADLKLVTFYDERGKPLDGGRDGQWPKAVAPGAASVWYDLGPTMYVETTTPFYALAHPAGARPGDRSVPFSMDIALAPNEKAIVKSFTLDPGEPCLSVLVQPDLTHPEGVAATRKIRDIYQELTRQLLAQPRLGPMPKKLRFFGATSSIYPSVFPTVFPDGEDVARAFREAMGLNTFQLNASSGQVAATLARGAKRGAVVERSLGIIGADIAKVVARVKANGEEKAFYYAWFGDEIGIPDIDVNDPKMVEGFREFLRTRGETPHSLGLPDWDHVKPMASFSGGEAARVGVLPEASKADPRSLEGLKRLYWYSLAFRNEVAIAGYAAKTRALNAAMGDEAETTANIGGLFLPLFWMDQTLYIDMFKHRGLSLAWSEDYSYCQPEASRMDVDFQTAFMRKGVSYHDARFQFYCMPHWPGNNAEQLLQNAVLEWGQNVKDFDFFCSDIDAYQTENYIAYRGGLPMFRAVRTLSGMAGLIEDDLLPARPPATPVAMLVSQASDVWETDGRKGDCIVPGGNASNVSQEERKNIWYALRDAGYRVDIVTEDDCAEGLLRKYAVLYICSGNLEHKAAEAIRDWVRGGGTVFATAGAAHRDEFDAPLTTLDEVFGRGATLSYERFKGPLRARMELLFVRPLDELTLAGGKTLPVYCSREQFKAAPAATVLATFADGQPALVCNDFGTGRAYFTGALPGEAYVKAALPVLPQGKGGPHDKPWMREWLNRDPVAADVILLPLRNAKIAPDVTVNHRGVVTNRLESQRSIVVTVVNLALEADGELKNVELRVANVGRVKRAWSCFHAKRNLIKNTKDGVVTLKLPHLGPSDVIVLER